METKTEVKTYKIDFKCPNCSDGYLRPTGMVLMSYPARYPHNCTHCDYKETFFKKYPTIEYGE